ncbi:CENP-C_C domain-containing protein, partial [Nephila pilipes]
MKGLKGKSRSLNIGRRSRMNVVLGKRIRAQEDGTEVFDDYWTDSDPENSRLTNTSVAPVVDHESSSSEEEEIAKKSCRKLNSNLSNVGERNLSNNYDSEISNLLRDQRNERIPKVRKWLSVSLAGSVKSIGKSFKTKAVKDKAINTSCDKPKQSPNTSEKKDHCYLTFQRDPTDRNSGSEADVEMDVYSRNVSKNFQASKVVQDLSLKSSSFGSTKKEMQLKETENMDEEKSDSDVSTVERFPLTERSVLLKNRILSITSKEAQQTELQIPEKLSSVQNDINDNNESAKAVMSSIKKVEKRSRVEAEYDSDSTLEIFPSKVEVSRNRRHSSSRHSSYKESAQFERSISHINKTVNTSIKKHQIQRTSTPKNNVSKNISGRFAKLSLSRKRLIVDYDSDSNSENSPSDDEISRITSHISTAIVPTNKNSSLVMSVSFENNSDLEKRMHGLRVRKNLFQLKNDSSKLRYLEQSPDKRKNREVSADQQIHLSPEKSLSKP